MRIWLVHPSLFDQKAISGQWFEAIMARNALTRERHGYQNHPALNIFKNSEHPARAVDTYLNYLYEESIKRGYKFNKKYLNNFLEEVRIKIGFNELVDDFDELQSRLNKRDSKYDDNVANGKIMPNPLFEVK